MKPLSLAGVAAFLAFALNGAAATTPAETPAPIIWRLDQAARVGGHATAVLGNPVASAADGLSGLSFDGAADAVVVPANPLAGWEAFTVEILIRPSADGKHEQRFLHLAQGEDHRVLIELRMNEDGRWCVDTFLCSEENRLALIDRARLHKPDTWTWIALTYKDGWMAHHVDGVKECEGAVNFAAMTSGQTSIGARLNRVHWFKGAIAEARFHPTVLAAAEMQKAEKREATNE